jgi:hypothetical protein
MAHYAFLDENNIVTQVIVGRNEDELGIDWEQHYAEIKGQVCKRTSYNNRIRKQYAGIGFSYDPVADVFILPQPFPSWTLDSNHDWQAPKVKPSEGFWYWDESKLDWVEDEIRNGRA